MKKRRPLTKVEKSIIFENIVRVVISIGVIIGLVFIYISADYLIVSIARLADSENPNAKYSNNSDWHYYEARDFKVNRVCFDGKHISYILYDEEGNSITLTDTPTIADENHIIYRVAQPTNKIATALDMVGYVEAMEFTVDMETANEMGAVNGDIEMVLEEESNNNSLLWFTTGYLLRNLSNSL